MTAFLLDFVGRTRAPSIEEVAATHSFDRPTLVLDPRIAARNYRALKAGASGFVLKDIPRTELVSAVRTVAEGGALIAPSITRRLIERFAQRLAGDTAAAARLERLTDREREVLIAIGRGLNNAEISEELFIGAATVKTHINSVFTKLGLRDRAQAVVFAYESGLVEPGEQEVGF